MKTNNQCWMVLLKIKSDFDICMEREYMDGIIRELLTGLPFISQSIMQRIPTV